MQFLKVHDGGHILNIAHISDIEVDWEYEGWTVTMVSGNQFTVEEEDLVNLKKILGIEEIED